MAEKRIIVSRGQNKGSVSRIYKFCLDEALIEKSTVDIISVKKDRLISSFKEYTDLNVAIMALDTEEGEDVEEIEEKYTYALAKLNELLRTKSLATLGACCSGSKQVEQNYQRLPRIEIPKFNGQVGDYYSFQNMFTSVIDSDKRLSSCEKFYYLRSLLQGEALDVIKHLLLDATNYPVALKLLADRYDNKVKIINHHIAAILDMKPIHRSTPQSLRELVANTRQHLSALKGLNVPVNTWDVIMITILQRKLDQYTLRGYHLEACTVNNHSLPLLKDLLIFLEQRATALENVGSAENLKHALNKNSKSALVATTITTSGDQQKCKFCFDSNHNLYECCKFKLASINKRISFVEANKLCKICLNAHIKKCRYYFKCAICKAKHNTLLHEDKPAILTNQVSLMSKLKSDVLLPTVTVKLFGKNGKEILIRALLDSGSQVSFILQELTNEIQCDLYNEESTIIGVCDGSSKIKQKAQFSIYSTVNKFTTTVQCCVVQNITSKLPQFNMNVSELQIPSHIQLADRKFGDSDTISLLLGCDIMFQILLREQISIIPGRLFLHNTQLGYVVAGRVSRSSDSVSHPTSNLCKVSHDELPGSNSFQGEQTDNINSLNNNLEKFWECEKVPEIYKEANSEHELAEQIFTDSVVLNNGRFQVSLPLKQEFEKIKLGDSLSCALQRFYNLEHRFKKNPQLFADYKLFIHEYISLGHAKYVNISNYNTECNPVYILPHHPVINENSKTTRLRVVFDGSMQTKEKISLNDIMLNGPVVQAELFDILMLFRLNKFILIADVKKLFRQVRLDPTHCALQNILWRDEPTQNVQCIQLQTVTYGLKSSTFLATRCLVELANRYRERYPLAATILLQNTYVDDIHCGNNNLNELLEAKKQLIELLRLGGFTLHKWCSNNLQLLEDIPITDRNIAEIDFCKGENNCIKTLGITYNVQFDSFIIICAEQNVHESYTKRQVLRLISKIFDPLGLIGPILVSAKVILQKTWQTKVSWDEPLLSELNESFKNFVQGLIKMSNITIRRNINTHLAQTVELVGFSDASNKAYGCCLYLRIIDIHGNVTVSLLCSKSRVNPIKMLSIPRLELNGALLLAKLAHKVKDILKPRINLKVYLYVDSQIVLAWLRTEPLKLSVYVANRVKNITELTQGFTWLYINTSLNPADCLSRGVEPDSLQENALWWHGPQNLQSIEYKHYNEFINLPEELPEVKTCNVSIKNEQLLLFTKYSDINKMKRILAYVYRFYNNCFNKKVDRKLGHLACSELEFASLIIIKKEQEKYFAKEIEALQSRQNIKSNLKSFNPFLDKMGILRVGGRLHHADIPYSQKHPIILPKGSRITHLIILNEHRLLLHASQKLILSSLNQKYYIINGLREVKHVIHKCVTCFKLKAETAEQLMGSLPPDRVNPSRVFQKVGVDFGGPFYIKLHRVRKPFIYKAYIVLFVCFTTKAIHIELVSNMTTECFLNCLKRFIARRNKPSIIYCDNASTFKGANNQLNELYLLQSNKDHKNAVQTLASNLGIEFSFIPSYSPVFGGLWEAGIKSAKYHLKRVVGTSVLTYEELNTVVIQIEGILNSRPLIALPSNDPDMPYSYLTPGHFLTGTSLSTYPEPDVTNININRLAFWNQCKHMVQHFWKLWHKQYLVQLQNRPKWRKDLPNIKKGTLVLMKEDNVSPLKWPMARVVEVFPGRDGKVRALSVKTSRGLITRTSVTKICVLPMENVS